MEPITIADFVRGIMVSASALIIGFSITTTTIILRGRKIGKIYSTPPWVNILFVLGYNLLLISVIVGRWNSINRPFTVSSAIAAAGLTLNVIAVLAYSHYIEEYPGEST